jgi:hypothetical protein
MRIQIPVILSIAAVTVISLGSAALQGAEVWYCKIRVRGL